MFIRFDDLRIIPDQNYEKVPLACPVCDYMMCHGDTSEYRKYNCCKYCSMFFAYPNSKKWKEGWRPPETEIDRVIKNREREPIYTMRGLKC